VHYYFPGKTNLAQAPIDHNIGPPLPKLYKDIAKQRWGLKRKLDAYIGIFDDVVKNDRNCLCGMMATEVESLTE